MGPPRGREKYTLLNMEYETNDLFGRMQYSSEVKLACAHKVGAYLENPILIRVG